jgi:hypothetical protein
LSQINRMEGGNNLINRHDLSSNSEGEEENMDEES